MNILGHALLRVGALLLGLVMLSLVLVNPSLIWADDGTLTYVEMPKDGVNGVDGLNGVKLVTVSPD
jgi:hypothetical protein